MTLTWATAHRMALRAANQAHRDARVARSDYIDVFAALEAIGVCCLAKPLRGLAGTYAAPGAGGPAVLLNSGLDETTIRHTAAHELGHHVFRHGSKMDEHVDPDHGGLGGPWPNDEKLAEAFAPWFLMPLPAVRTAMRRAGVGNPMTAEAVHQLACWLGTSYAGTARHLANLRLISAHQASEFVRVWHAKGAKIRAGMAASAVPPSGRVWVVRAAASEASLHVVPGDTLVYGPAELSDPLPPGLAAGAGGQLTLDGAASAVVTSELTRPSDLTMRSADGLTTLTVRLIPPPRRVGIATAWGPRDPDTE